MGYLRKTSFLSYPLVVFFIVSIYINNVYALRGVFKLKMKSANSSNLKRQTPHRMLADGIGAPMDFHLGGNISAWEYYAEVSIGTPPQNLLLQIDTGSDITWISCQGCDGCAMDDDKRGIHLKPYNPEASTTAEIIKHDNLFCKKPDSPCIFNTSYYDGTGVSGYYVKDYLNYNKVTCNHNTEPAKAEFTFACTTKQVSSNSGNFLRRGIVGALGLGTYRSMVFRQMNTTNDARNMFSICMDKNRGGGIFAVGKLVKPVVPMIKYLNNSSGTYELNIQSMMFGEVKIELNGAALAVFDTGSTVGFIPAYVQTALADMIAGKFSVAQEHFYNANCFSFLGMDVSAEFFDEVLPTWTFRFSDTISLSVSPRNYMVNLDAEPGRWCIRTNKHDFDGLFTLGVPFLSEKLVVYDNENKSIGFVDYDCTSTVEVEGEDAGEVFEVDSHSEELHF